MTPEQLDKFNDVNAWLDRYVAEQVAAALAAQRAHVVGILNRHANETLATDGVGGATDRLCRIIHEVTTADPTATPAAAAAPVASPIAALTPAHGAVLGWVLPDDDAQPIVLCAHDLERDPMVCTHWTPIVVPTPALDPTVPRG